MYNGKEPMEDHMSRKILSLGFVLLLVACGRSGIDDDSYVDINVGISSLTGDTVTQDQVQSALELFQFELNYLADKPDCIKAGPCIWYAEGLVPAGKEKVLQGYRYKDLHVVYVQKVAGRSTENPLPTR